MIDNDYTEEDLDTYIEYTRLLYEKIKMAFTPKIEIKRSDGTPMDEYMEKMTTLLTMNLGAVDKVYTSTLMPFGTWMYTDCPITGHKGKPYESPMFHYTPVVNPNISETATNYNSTTHADEDTVTD